jgi:hypothetical protein
MDKEKAKERVKQLVNEFSEYSKEELDKKSEIQIQYEFIDELFKALGWDMRKDVEREERVLKGRADYIFRIGNQESLVVEAKKTSIPLMEEQGRQAVSYAYHRKIKFSVLTNFKYIRVYHALSNIKNIDRNLLFWLEFKDFEKEFDKLWVLSKESFESQEINKLLSKKDEKKYKLIDDSILEDLLVYRRSFSTELKSKRTYLSEEQIDEVVQILIDRLIFMRSVEDRGLESEDFLLKIANIWEKGETEKNLWALLKEQFRRFDNTYNSKLFAEGLLEKQDVYFDGKVLMKVIKGLYYGAKHQQERYMFDEIPVDLLGSIYEQYLGTILRGTEKRVKLDLESGKRKKMGIYYTPSYIVDYIVKNTVKEYVREKTIDEILEVKILDPACGSGSFLIRAFQEVCNIIEEKLKKGGKSKKWKTFQAFNGRLSMNQKSIILKNCIYGVDLDEKAVELAQLNLMLKLLEEETRETRDKILPMMKHNIKCGNSLIDDSKVAGDKAFNWKAQFPEVFSEGGFDVVVGNPPYGAVLKEKERKYLEDKFKLRNTDTAVLFMGLAKDLLKPAGINSFIVPKPFVYSSTWTNIRESLLGGIREVVDCGKVWKEVKLEQIIYFYWKEENFESYNSCVRENDQIKNLGEINKRTFSEFGFLLNGISEEELKVGEKIKSVGGFFNDFVINQRGAIYQKYIKQKGSQNDFKVLGGKQLSWYFIDDKIKGYIPKEIVKDEKAFIKENSLLAQRIVAHLTKPKDHIKIISCLSNLINWKNYVIVDTINQLQNKGKVSSEFLLAIINSKLVSWYVYRFIFGKAIRTMQFDNPVTKRIPIPKKIDKSQEQKIISLVEKMLELQKKFHDDKIAGREKEMIEQQIKQTDYEIDQEVYKLYGITEEEKRVIEGSLK